MSDLEEEDGNDQRPDLEEDDGNDQRPIIELFVKAAADKMKNGGCPMCHRYFLIFYILREHGLIDLVVTTFLPESPPKEVLEFSPGKRYPLVKVRGGIDAHGHDMTGVECDNVVEIEALLERFDCDIMHSSKDSEAEAIAEKTFDDLYMKFCQFLKTEGTPEVNVIKILEKVESHLRDNGSRFMLSDTLSRADCYLLPTLQHIRVAGKAYKNFEIPTELGEVWHYLKNAYMTDAFLESCPADREIITHYTGKMSSPRLPANKSHLLGEDRTLSVPDIPDDN